MKNKAQYQFFRKIAMFGVIFIFLFIFFYPGMGPYFGCL